ncbi:hypothetical protein BGY98DRAFT_1025481 [Russula aff. rugulosa BPL654]|nr:hypothetical protein BGY98DRAFT_1025481 [Russula aff. rugulosa BPL654]
MTMTPNSSKILSLLRKSPRSSDTTPMPAKTPRSDLDSILAELAPGDVLSFQRFHWQSMKADTKLGALETSIAVLSEAANLASNIPYLAAVASMIVYIIKIRYEVDIYREMWEDVMYNVVKVVDLVRHFCASCQRHGLCDEATFPQNFIGIIKEVENEFVRVAEVLSQCSGRGKTKFERFKRGLARNDMIREIGRCDRHMSRIFERFMSAMVVDIRFQQLLAEKAQSTSISVPQAVPTTPLPTTPTSMTIPFPNSPPIPPAEPLTLASQVRHPSAGWPRSGTMIRSFLRPVRPQVFFGRDAELKNIVDLIFSPASPARVVILGPGGVGKTALAHAVLTHDRVMSRFGDSRYIIPCESLNSREALVVALADRLSLLQPGTTSECFSMGLESRVLSVLASDDCILCLDDFESPWDQPGPIKRAVEHLLADITALPSVTVLITMRGGERPKETAWTLPICEGTWECLAGTCDEWAEKLIDAVDCLPLAVTLLEMLWKEKGDKFSSLDFSIALSLESGRMATDSSSRRLLGILSLLPDGLPPSPSLEFRRLFPDISDISRSLDTLLARSLAVRTADKRVQVNSLVRLYCENHGLAAPGDRRALRDYYVTLASHAYDDLGPDMFERMKAEMNNMESITPVVEAVIAYTQFCTYIGNFSDAPSPTLGDCLASLDVLYRRDNIEEAKTRYQNAYDLYVRAYSTYGQANALTHLGDADRKLGNLQESCSHYQRSLAFHQEHDDRLGQANSLKGLGHVYLRMNDMPRARERFEQALELHKAVNDVVGQANDMLNLADVYQRLDNLTKAEGAYKGALRLHGQANDDLGRGNTLSHLGDLYRKQNKLSRAEEYYTQALQSHEKASDMLGQANDFKGLGGIYCKKGDRDKAVDKYNDALKLYEAIKHNLGKANCLKALGQISYSKNMLHDASEMFQNAFENYQRADDSIGQGNALNGLGDVERRSGSLIKAEQLYKRALDAHRKADDKIGQGNDYKGLGILYEKQSKLKDAKEMFEIAIEMHKESGSLRSEKQDEAHLGKVDKKLAKCPRITK